MESKIRNALGVLINQGYKDFVIYPYGKYGQLTKQILNNEFMIQELYVADNVKSKEYKDIKDLDYMKKDYFQRGFLILLAVDPLGWDTSLLIHRSLVDFVDIKRIADLLAWSPYFTPWDHYEKINSLGRPKIALLECIAREIYKNGIQGAVAEAGVFQGETARFLNLLFPDRKLFLFDTFEGFNKDDQDKDDERGLYNRKIDYSGTSEDMVLERMHFPDNCIVKKGWFPESALGLEEKFSLVRLDMDLYDPIYAGLDYFYPRMEKGGYIVIHDCRSKNFDGARKALIDFCKERHIGYMCMPDNLGSAVINIGF